MLYLLYLHSLLRAETSPLTQPSVTVWGQKPHALPIIRGEPDLASRRLVNEQARARFFSVALSDLRADPLRAATHYRHITSGENQLRAGIEWMILIEDIKVWLLLCSALEDHCGGT